MFNISKENVDGKAEELSKKAKSNIEVVSEDLKSKADIAADTVKEKTEVTRDKASQLVDSLRVLLSEYSDTNNINRVKDQLSIKAHELKEVVAEGVTNAYQKSREKTADAVVEHPVGTLALAAGAGLLLGYILASKQSHK